MTIGYKVTGPERKALAKAIGDILALEVTYKGAPSFAYEIGGCTIDKSGNLTFSEGMSGDESVRLIDVLKERGYIAEPSHAVSDELAEEDPDSLIPNELVVEIPKEGFNDEAIDNLKKIIASKKTLIEKSLDIADLPFNEDCLAVEIGEDKLRFPWFRLTGSDGEVDAYSHFICAMCEMAKTQKRVTAKEQPVENDKFAMRIFLVRLGLKGPENKGVRHIMLRNLTGNSSWKNGKPEKSIAAETVPADDALFTKQDTDTSFGQETSKREAIPNETE